MLVVPNISLQRTNCLKDTGLADRSPPYLVSSPITLIASALMLEKNSHFVSNNGMGRNSYPTWNLLRFTVLVMRPKRHVGLNMTGIGSFSALALNHLLLQGKPVPVSLVLEM
jgi:hypothetical protein